MPASEFQKALKAVLVHEGGYVDHPKDPGGETMRGVTKRVYDAFRDRQQFPRQSVRLISEDEIEAIYRRQYWDAVKGDDLPAGVAYCVFDFAVNSGPGRAAKALQRALSVTVDGQIGMATAAAASAHPDHDALINAICDERLAFVQQLKTWPTFGRGWAVRIAGVRKRAQAWASGSVGPAPVIVEGAEQKASPRDAGPRPGTGSADAMLGAGAGTAGTIMATTVVIKEAQAQLEPLAGASSWIGTIVAVLAVSSAGLMIGGLVLRWYQTGRAAAHDEALG